MLPGTTAEFSPLLRVSGVIADTTRPLGAAPAMASECTWPVFFSNIVAKPFPAMLELCGSTTLRTAATATAASKAFPPASRMRRPAIDASGWALVTSP